MSGVKTDIVLDELQAVVKTFNTGLENVFKSFDLELRNIRKRNHVARESRDHRASKGREKRHVRESSMTRPEAGLATCMRARNLSIGRSDGECNWLAQDSYEEYTNRLKKFEKTCQRLAEELKHLEEHYRRVGGDQVLIQASESLRSKISGIFQPVKCILEYQGSYVWIKLGDLMNVVWRGLSSLRDDVTAFHDSLYHQKHAFYFRRVREFEERFKSGCDKIYNLKWNDEKRMRNALQYMFGDFFDNVARSMEGVTAELQVFAERSLPTFLADEKEREATQYIHITTIATFFSSVTATTLQMSMAYPPSHLWDIVNFFWFVSLIFSVSAGVSSLLALTWRKSTIHDKCSPPRLIKLWLEKASMALLVIAALTFIAGLNAFVYLSGQARFVALSTNALTGMHSLCLLVVVMWFAYHLKRDSQLVKRIERLLSKLLRPLGRCIRVLVDCIYGLYISDFSLHMQRNLYWAFGYDRRMFQLNWEIGWDRKWPHPHIFAKVTRVVTHPLRVVFHGASFIAKSLAENKEGDFDYSGDPRRTDQAEQSGPVAEYQRAIEDTFGRSRKVDYLMEDVSYWVNGLWCDEQLRQLLNQRLWGYPDFVDTVFRPQLVELRSQARIVSVTANMEARGNPRNANFETGLLR